MLHTLAWGLPMGPEWIVIGALGLLIFGKRLPDLGKGVGSAIKNFKLGLKSGETDEAAVPEEKVAVRKVDEVKPSFKFDPNTGKPLI